MATAFIILMAELIFDVVLDAAYDWLCCGRCDYPDDANVWDLRCHWPAEEACL
jgi:hypothetical protein